MSAKPLSSLPFLDAVTSTVTSIDKQRNIKASIHENLLAYDPRGSLHKYKSKIASISINDVTVTAISTSPTYVLRDITKSRDLIIPLTNTLTLNSAKTTLRLDPGDQCFFEGLGVQSMNSACGSYVRIKCNLKSLFWDDGNPGSATAPELPGRILTIDKISASEIKYLLSLINRHSASAQFLQKICADHLIFNLLKRLLTHDTQLKQKDYKSVRPEITLLCAFLIEHIEQPISMYLMETVSGLSSKTIQNAFRKYYNCRPMEWVRNERLEKARLLIRDDPKRSITELAYHLGFCSPSNFCKFYKLRFHELPSQMQKKSHKAMIS